MYLLVLPQVLKALFSAETRELFKSAESLHKFLLNFLADMIHLYLCSTWGLITQDSKLLLIVKKGC